MSKNRNKKRAGLSKADVMKKQYKQSMNTLLERVYNQEDLTTTCCGTGACCKTACPSMNYSEFLNAINYIWNHFSNDEKVELLSKSIEYYFKNSFEKWGIQTLVKPCLLYDRGNKKCKIYEKRCLSCRLYGMWPKEDYEARVDRFVKAYEPFGLSKCDLPLNEQCDKVVRNDKIHPLTKAIIDNLYVQLDGIDAKVSDFTPLQIKNKSNYRSFHDWLLLKVYGEEWLGSLTAFMMASDREAMEDQIEQFKIAIKSVFSDKNNSMNVTIQNKIKE